MLTAFGESPGRRAPLAGCRGGAGDRLDKTARRRVSPSTRRTSSHSLESTSIECSGFEDVRDASVLPARSSAVWPRLTPPRMRSGRRSAASTCLLQLVLQHKEAVLAFVDLDVRRLLLDRKRHGV